MILYVKLRLESSHSFDLFTCVSIQSAWPLSEVAEANERKDDRDHDDSDDDDDRNEGEELRENSRKAAKGVAIDECPIVKIYIKFIVISIIWSEWIKNCTWIKIFFIISSSGKILIYIF